MENKETNQTAGKSAIQLVPPAPDAIKHQIEREKNHRQIENLRNQDQEVFKIEDAAKEKSGSADGTTYSYTQ